VESSFLSSCLSISVLSRVTAFLLTGGDAGGDALLSLWNTANREDKPEGAPMPIGFLSLISSFSSSLSLCSKNLGIIPIDLDLLIVAGLFVSVAGAPPAGLDMSRLETNAFLPHCSQ